MLWSTWTSTVKNLKLLKMRNEKIYLGFHIPKIWQILKRFTQQFHQAYDSYFWWWAFSICLKYFQCSCWDLLLAFFSIQTSSSCYQTKLKMRLLKLFPAFNDRQMICCYVSWWCCFGMIQNLIYMYVRNPNPKYENSF